MKVFFDIATLDTAYYLEIKNKHPYFEFTSDLLEGYEADIAILHSRHAKEAFLKPFTKLKWIQLLTAGYDSVDVDYILSQGILLSYAKDVFSVQIAEDVFSKILYFNRNLGYYHDHKKQGLWKEIPVLHEISNSTFGIIGAGSIGYEIAIRAKIFGAKVIGYRRTLTIDNHYDQLFNDEKGLEYLLRTSDYIILSLPLNQHTKHMIGKKEFKLMKSSALLINVARGGVVDQEALIEALNQGQIRGAGLDVVTPEPLPSNHLLWEAKNLFLTPHNASASPFMKQRLFHEVDDNLKRYYQQLPLDNLVKH